MSTQNRRVAAYLPKSIDDRLKAFIAERNLKGDSQALIIILSEYFEVSREVAHISSSDLEHLKSDLLSKLSSKLLNMKAELKSELLGELRSDLYQNPTSSSSVDNSSESPSISLGNSLNGTISELPSESVEESQVSDVEPVEMGKTDDQAESRQHVMLPAVELARRLNVGGSTISVRKGESTEKFAKWSCNKDPDGITWAFVPELNGFQPVGNVPPEILEGLLSEPLEGLTTGELSKRLGVAPSTLSHRKKEKTSQELTDWIRKRDPDGVGWIFLPGANRFSPEDKSDGEPKVTLQGELLGEPSDELNSSTSLNQVNPLAPEGSERSEEG